jgi:3-deoxy-7-phosphoheptulonate synthase
MRTFSTPQDLKNQLPLYKKEHIASSRQTIGNILKGQDSRILLLVGPCSIHDVNTAKEYAQRLQKLSQEVGDVFFIAMRAYFEKSRTALGWKGLMHDPYLDGSNNLQEGLKASRSLLLYLSELNLAAATEFLEPLSHAYISDLISWGAIGARTCQSPIHRHIASSLEMPIGFKNRCDGNINIAIQACLTAKEPHRFLGINDNGYVAEIEGKGNNLTHIVLRGSETKPNYDAESVQGAYKRLKQANLHTGLIIDCAHGNSQKNHLQQQLVFENIINQIAGGSSIIRGIMLESFLEAGTQKETLNKSLGQSITDPCLDWQTTQHIILQGADVIRSKALSCV